jgi:hypothetical protein
MTIWYIFSGFGIMDQEYLATLVDRWNVNVQLIKPTQNKVIFIRNVLIWMKGRSMNANRILHFTSILDKENRREDNSGKIVKDIFHTSFHQGWQISIGP